MSLIDLFDWNIAHLNRIACLDVNIIENVWYTVKNYRIFPWWICISFDLNWFRLRSNGQVFPRILPTTVRKLFWMKKSCIRLLIVDLSFHRSIINHCRNVVISFALVYHHIFAKLCRNHRLVVVLNDYDCQFSIRQGDISWVGMVESALELCVRCGCITWACAHPKTV